MARSSMKFRQKSTPERERQVKKLKRVKKTIIVQGQERTVRVAICPPPMECEDLAPPRRIKKRVRIKKR